MQRHFVLHIGETNSGKTYDAIEALKKCDKGIYLAPLRLLAYEQYDKLNNEGYSCSLITGEERMIVDHAKYQASTIEMLDILEEYDIAIIDEAQMLGDKFRGGSWTKALLGVRAHEIHICAAPQVEDILIKLISACHDTYEVIKHERNTQLIKETKTFSFPKSVQKGDALIVFSRKSVHAVANELKNKNIKASIIYGALPYDVRQNEAKRFARGKTDVVVATDAIGMGMNLPIKRVVFLEQQKYNGESVKTLSAIEVKQIAGRAGRYGVFNEGYVNSYGNRKQIYKLLDSQISAISKVYINFPESLIGIDAPVSDILERWQNIPIDNGYEKANIDHELKLVKIAEEITDVKSIIYDFITMPFDENDELLRNLWFDMLTNYSLENHLKFNDLKNKYLQYMDYQNMESLEKVYKICDMIFYYDEKFHNGIESKDIMNIKSTISQAIIKLLEKSKLQPRKCKYCGKVLPWNYQYNMCNQCHNERYTHYYNDYY